MISNKKFARIAGLLYLIVIGTGLFAEVFVRQALRVPGDAMATAQNVQASEMLYRLGFVADIFNLICGIPCVLIIYFLFKSVNKFLVSVALILVIIQTAIIATNLLNQTAPLLLLSKDPFMAVFSAEQLAALSLHSLNLQAQGYGIALIFFGFYCIIIGLLIFKSKLMPPIIGVLYAVAGLSYIMNSMNLFLFPETSFFVYFAIPSFIGELTFCLYLIIVGIREKTIPLTSE